MRDATRARRAQHLTVLSFASFASFASFLLVTAIGACAPSSTGPTYPVSGRAMAGPTCPVEPPSPAPGECAERPVANAVLVVIDQSGHEAARLTTGPDGAFSASLPAGTYTLTPQPVQGLIGGAPPVRFTVAPDASPGPLHVEYDTGIR